MRRLALIAAATTTGLIAAGVLGAATAQSPAPTPPRAVSVQGAGSAAIDSAAGGDAAGAAYRQALGSAVADGQSKAVFLVGRVGGALGAVQSVSEDGGSIDCGQGEYAGAQPDFGTGPSVQDFSGVSRRSRGPSAVGSPTTGTHKPKKPKKPVRRKRGKAHAAATCTLSAQVSLVYALS